MQFHVRTLVAVTGAAILVVGGTAAALAGTWAASTTAGNTVHACQNAKTHVLYGRVGKNCPKGYKSLSWNIKGPRGATGPQGPAGIAAARTFTEVDNGAQFAVSTSPDVADTSASGATYSDAGVVVNVGAVGKLSAAGIAFTGTGPLAENIWIGDGAEASTAGIYPLSGGADFCYGLGQNPDSSGQPTSFYLTDAACGSYEGQTLTLAQLAADFPPSLQAYAWVGVVSSGGAVNGTVSNVGGQRDSAKMGVLANTGGTLTAFVS